MWLKPENVGLKHLQISLCSTVNKKFTYLSAPDQREQWGSPQNPFQSRDVLLLCFTFKADFRFSLNSPKNLLPPYDLWLSSILNPFQKFWSSTSEWACLFLTTHSSQQSVYIVQVYLQVSARQLIQTIWAGTHDPTPTLPLLCGHGQDSWCLRKASLAGFLKTWSTHRKWLEHQKNAVPWHDTIHCAGQWADEKFWFYL